MSYTASNNPQNAETSVRCPQRTPTRAWQVRAKTNDGSHEFALRKHPQKHAVSRQADDRSVQSTSGSGAFRMHVRRSNGAGQQGWRLRGKLTCVGENGVDIRVLNGALLRQFAHGTDVIVDQHTQVVDIRLLSGD